MEVTDEFTKILEKHRQRGRGLPTNEAFKEALDEGIEIVRPRKRRNSNFKRQNESFEPFDFI